MLNTVVVVDSEFGNTFALAEAMAEEFRSAGSVNMINVRDPDHQELDHTVDIDLFVVGGPTQMHGLSKPLATYLDSLHPRALFAVASACFDTRLRGWALMTGAASSGIARRLKKHGAYMVLPPESFLVLGREGPLADGEAERARKWARQLLAVVARPLAGATSS